MATNRDYNGVTIEKSWSIKEFAREFGACKFANCTNSETGEVFDCLAFDDGSKVTFAHFGYSTEGFSPADIKAKKDNLKIGLNSSGNYTVYLNEGGWETIDLF